MSRHTYGENLISIRQGVTEKQTDKQEEDVVQSTILAKSIKQV